MSREAWGDGMVLAGGAVRRPLRSGVSSVPRRGWDRSRPRQAAAAEAEDTIARLLYSARERSGTSPSRGRSPSRSFASPPRYPPVLSRSLTEQRPTEGATALASGDLRVAPERSPSPQRSGPATLAHWSQPSFGQEREDWARTPTGSGAAQRRSDGERPAQISMMDAQRLVAGAGVVADDLTFRRVFDKLAPSGAISPDGLERLTSFLLQSVVVSGTSRHGGPLGTVPPPGRPQPSTLEGTQERAPAPAPAPTVAGGPWLRPWERPWLDQLWTSPASPYSSGEPAPATPTPTPLTSPALQQSPERDASMERISALEEEVTLLREALLAQQLPSPIPRTESAVHASAAPDVLLEPEPRSEPAYDPQPQRQPQPQPQL